MKAKLTSKARMGLGRLLRRLRADRGMATAEYAMGVLAAVAFAGVLYKVVTSGVVSAALESLIGKALGAQF